MVQVSWRGKNYGHYGSKIIFLLAALSIVVNFYLVWQWQLQKINYQVLVAGQSNRLEQVGKFNQRLTQQNQGYKVSIVDRDRQLAEKSQLLRQKEEELTALTSQFEVKKKELEQKEAELAERKAQLAKTQKQIDNQNSQLEANSAELSKLRNRPPLFSFQNQSSTLSDIEAKKESVKKIVTSAYDVIEDIYGKPYLLHAVTISFVDKFSNEQASGEILITSSEKGLDLEIRLKDFNENSFNDINTLIHEIVHSFHGPAVLEPTAFEEGITVAATDGVMRKMISAGVIPNFSSLYIRLTEAQYVQYQQSYSIPSNQNSFYSSDNVANFYQVLGKAWYNLYLADSDFFKKFNENIYAKKLAGVEITQALVLQSVLDVAPTASLTGAAWQLGS